MEEILRALLEKLHNAWQTPAGLCACIATELLILSPYFYDNFGTGLSTPELVLLGSLITGTCITWLISRIVPKNSKDAVGIIVAIKTDNKNESIKLKHNFIEKMRKNVESAGHAATFKLIPYSEFHANRINNEDTARRALENSRAHFIIYGDCRRRTDRGDEVYFIDTEAAVRHTSIPVAISKEFALEFAQTFPRKVIFDAKNELTGFEVTRATMALVTEYILAIAAYLSGDFDFSLKSYLRLKEQLPELNIDSEQVGPGLIAARLPMRLSETYLALATRKHFAFRRSRDEKYLVEAKPYLDELEKLDPENYQAHLLRAIYFFSSEKNLEKAMAELERAQNKKDPTWLYSKAFLMAYKGDLGSAEACYTSAMKIRVDPAVVFEIEEFIAEFLERNENHPQLFYCLGLINAYAKPDPILAKAYFKKFVNSIGEGYAKQKYAAIKYITNRS